MDFNGFTLPDLTPRIDTSFIDEMNRQNQEMLDSITPLNEILAEEIKPILEGNQKVVEGLNDNYSKLNDLYLLKEKELEESKQEAEKQRNTIQRCWLLRLFPLVLRWLRLLLLFLSPFFKGGVS